MKKITNLMFVITLFISVFTQAQDPGDIVQSFGTASGFNLNVTTTVVQPDGKILVAGAFTSYNGLTENNIIRLNSDGSKDESFTIGLGFNSVVNSMVLQPDGKIVVAGTFTTFNGNTENRIVRLNPDGTKDTSFITGTGFDSFVYSIALQSDGKIVAGGVFSSYNSVAGVGNIIRLNADGSKDASFNTGTGFNSSVGNVAFQPDGKIVVAGSFTAFNGITGKNRIIRLNSDGSNDASFITGTGFNNSAGSLTLQPNGKIIVTGLFTSYKGVTENRIIRLNNDGTKDTSFVTGTGFNGVAYKTVLQPDGKIIIPGQFTSYNGVTEIRIIRLNTDGSKDATFVTGTGFNASTEAIAQQADGKIIVGGNFSSYNGLSFGRIVRLNTDGSVDTALNTGLGFFNTIVTTVEQPDGKIIVGGLFTAYKGSSENFIVRLNADGTKDTSFVTGTGFNNAVSKIALQPDGKILAVGNFTLYNGVAASRIIRLNSDGSRDLSFVSGSGFNNAVNSVVIQPDGKILAAGNFVQYNGQVQTYIIRLNADGSRDTSFNLGGGFDNFINQIVLQPDGKIVAGGNFTALNGNTENRIIRLNSDGTKDDSFITGSGINNTVNSLALQTDGKVLVGGIFTLYNGVSEGRIIRLNSDGSKDVSFNTGTGFNNTVRVFQLKPDGKIIVGGQFTSFNNVVENRIICLNSDGSKDVSFDTGSGFNNSVVSLFLKSNNKLLVGGDFTTYKGDNSSAFLVGLHTTSVTPCNVSAPTAMAQSFCDSATVADLVAIGTNLKWYDAATGGTQLLSSAVLVTGTYYVSQTIDGCESERTAVNITITTIQVPTANAQSFCVSATVSQLTAIGTNLKWYDSAGLLLTPSTSLLTGSYFVTQTINGCESLKTEVIVTINSLPLAPVVSNQTFCGTTTIGDLQASGTNLKWYGVPSFGYVLHPTTVINTTGIYYVSQTVNGCEGPRTPVLVTNLQPNAPASIQPVAIDPSSFNVDVIVEGNVSPFISSFGTFDGFSARLVASSYSFNNTVVTNSLPESGFFSSVANSQVSYQLQGNKNLNAIQLRNFNETRTATFSTPKLTNKLFVLAATGNGNAIAEITVNFADGSTQVFSRQINDWYNGSGFAIQGIARVNTFEYQNPTNNPRLYEIELNVQSASPVTSVTFKKLTNDSSALINVMAISAAANALTMPTASTYCSNQTIAEIPVVLATGAIANFYTTAQGGQAVSNTSLVQSGTYYVSQTLNGCESIRTAISITVIPLVTYYADADNDGFGNPDMSIQSCSGAPMGYVMLNTDCNDNNAAINPNAIDVCYDGIDNDCNGNIDNIGLPGGCTPISSTPVAGVTNATIPYGTSILTSLIPNAQGYRYRVTRVNPTDNSSISAPVTVDMSLRNLFLSNLSIYAYGAKYKIETTVRINNVWQPNYAPAFYVFTPSPVSTMANCGTQIASTTSQVISYTVPKVTQYRYQVQRLDATNNVMSTQVITSALRYFSFDQVTDFRYDANYSVSCAIRNLDGVYMDYGPACTLQAPKHPTSELQATYCNNYTVTSANELIYANAIRYAAQYRFRLFNDAQTYDFAIDKNGSSFRLNDFPGLLSGVVYSVQVAVKMPGQPDFGPYSKTCTIIVPAMARTIEDEGIASAVSFEVIAYPNPFAEQFYFKVASASAADYTIQVYDMLGKLVENRTVSSDSIESTEVGANFPAGVYNVIVTQGENSKTLRVVKR